MQMNLLGDGDWLERTWPPDSPGFASVGNALLATTSAQACFELLPGESTFPYHYELGNDELLVMMTGRPTLRAPAGERELQEGDCVQVVRLRR